MYGGIRMNTSEELMAYAAVLGLSFGVALLITLIILVLTLIPMLVMGAIMGYPIKVMADRAGMRRTFWAFLPIGELCFAYLLPAGELNLFGKTLAPRRKKLLWVIILTQVLVYGPIFLLILLFPINFTFIGMPVYSVVMMICILLITICSYFLMFLNWKIHYDLYRFLNIGENALLFSILGTFIPLMNIILRYMYMNNALAYGDGNYYNYN